MAATNARTRTDGLLKLLELRIDYLFGQRQILAVFGYGFLAFPAQHKPEELFHLGVHWLLGRAVGVEIDRVIERVGAVAYVLAGQRNILLCIARREFH